MKTFLKFLALTFSLAIIIEGTHYGMLLMNSPSDLLFIAGVILLVASVMVGLQFLNLLFTPFKGLNS